MLIVMQRITILILFASSFLSGCLSTGYNQPVYIISDSSQEEEQQQRDSEQEEERRRNSVLY